MTKKYINFIHAKYSQNTVFDYVEKYLLSDNVHLVRKCEFPTAFYVVIFFGLSLSNAKCEKITL